MNPNSKKFKSINPGSPNSVKVDNDLSYAIKSWKRLLKDMNSMQECYDRKFYQKPSQIRRTKMQLAIYIQSKDTNENE